MTVPIWTPEKLLALGTPAPQLTATVESCDTLQNQPPLFTLDSLAQVRANLSFKRPAPDPRILETDIDCPVRDGTSIKLRWYRPATPAMRGSPLVVHYHGGGYIFGDLNTAAIFCHTMVLDHDAVVIDVNYRLAPEHPFPTGKNDAWDALQWVAKHYSSLTAQPSLGFLVTGCSAGGNIAASMALEARDRGLRPSLTGAYLNVPETISSEQKLPDKYAQLWLSRQQNKDAPVLNQSLIDFMMECYKPDLKSHYFAPAHHPLGHSGLPRTYVDVCGLDPFRDDGIIYELMLREAGVATKLSVFPGLPHGWWIVMPELQGTKQYHEKTREGLRWLLAEQCD